MTRQKIVSMASGIALLGTGLMLGGCETKAQTGAGVGALSGGLIGSLIGPSKNKEQNALIGAAIGGALGYMIGNEADKSDQNRISNSLENGRSNESSRWVNPDSGRTYVVTPAPPRHYRGRTCRDVELETIIDGRVEYMYGVACRRPNGTWEIVEELPPPPRARSW